MNEIKKRVDFGGAWRRNSDKVLASGKVNLDTFVELLREAAALANGCKRDGKELSLVIWDNSNSKKSERSPDFGLSFQVDEPRPPRTQGRAMPPDDDMPF